MFTAGGDGTYLLAASKFIDNNKPLIGLNTDPERFVCHIEPYQCLLKTEKGKKNGRLDLGTVEPWLTTTVHSGKLVGT